MGAGIHEASGDPMDPKNRCRPHCRPKVRTTRRMIKLQKNHPKQGQQVILVEGDQNREGAFL